MKFEVLRCPYCGSEGEARHEGDFWFCAHCGLKFTDIVNNANLGTETTPETVLAAEVFMHKLSEYSGLPIFAHTAVAEIAAQLQGRLEPVLPMKLQKKYFDLPSQKPGNRPLWG